jgi:hypothetical protein
MARTIAEIEGTIVAAVQADTTLSGASSTSQTAIWRLFARVWASAINAFEFIQDAFRAQLLEDVAKLKPHTLRWYQEKAKAFQYGSDLPENSTDYDNSSLDDATIAAQKIIAQAAATENNGTVTVKVAREVSGALEPLSSPQYDAFESYINEVKDAGVQLAALNQTGDKLTVVATIYYDPLVLNSTGARIDGAAAQPVQDAIKAYLRALPFNGVLVRASLFDVLQGVSGVYAPTLTSLQAGVSSATALGEVQVQYLPYAGYFKLSTLTLTLTFVSKDTL